MQRRLPYSNKPHAFLPGTVMTEQGWRASPARPVLGKGTVYEYFKSKKDLFMAVIKHACTVYIIFMKDIDNENRPFKEKLKKYILSIMSY